MCEAPVCLSEAPLLLAQRRCCKYGTPGRSSAAADWKPQCFAGKFHEQKQFDTCWDFGYSLENASAEPHLYSKQRSLDNLSCSSGEPRGERMPLENGAHLTMTTPTAHTAVPPGTKASEAATVPAAPSTNLPATLPQTQPQAALENNERSLEDWEEDAFAKLEKKSRQVVVS